MNIIIMILCYIFIYIYIAFSDFERRYPRGSKTILYKKAKVELYAPYFRTDSLIQKVTVYEDYEYTIPVQSYEKYSNRGDHLTESKKDFITNTVTDFFEKGRPDHCKGTIRSRNVTTRAPLCINNKKIF